MQIEVLKTFCDLVETKYLSRAAERNFVTQPAVSQQIRKLEAKFARQLFNRPGSGRQEFTPTPAGEVFYRECKRVLASYDALCEELRGELISGRIKVSSVYCAGIYDLPPMIREYLKQFPAVKIDLEYDRPGQVVRNVLNSLVDLGIIAFPVSNPALTLVPVSAGRLVLVCPPGHEFAQRRKIQAVELSGRGFILFEPGMPLRRATDKILNSHSVKICGITSFANINVVKLAVEAGFGLAVVPHSSVAYEERSKRLSIVELAEDDWVYPLGVVYRKGQKLSPAARKFVELLLEREVKK